MISSRKNWILKFSTIIVLIACFCVFDGALLGSKNLKNILSQWGEEAQLTVYLKSSVDVSEKEEIEGRIRQHEIIDSVTYISPEMAMNDFKKNMKNYAPEGLQEEEILALIPSSLQVKIKSDVAVADRLSELTQLAEVIKGYPGVDDVSYGQDWLEKFSGVVSFVERSLQFLILIITLASVFIVSNIIRASIYSKKEEIIVLEMVGATPGMIRKPFVMEGFVLSALASGVSIFICFLVYYFLMDGVGKDLAYMKLNETFNFFSYFSIALIIILQVLFGTLVSYFCVKSINDGFAGRSEIS